MINPFLRSPWRSILPICLLLSLSLGIPTAAWADAIAPQASFDIKPYLERVISKVTEFRLDNGLKFIVLTNPDAPVVSFVTYADVGGANEPDGKTGVAHFLEHLAFKGTRAIGTTNYLAEKQTLDQLDQVFGELKTAKASGNQARITSLEKQFASLQQKADSYVKQNEFGQIVEQSGGENINAQTSTDSTEYFYSFPSNKLELWMSLESDRFLDPVFREFYKEQQVILEERRTRTDNSPIGKLIEQFLDAAYAQHPYKRPVIGYDQDIRNLTRQDVEAFFKTYYSPGQLTIAIVGDVDPQQVKKLAQTYFGRFPAKPAPPKVSQVEPKQTQPRDVSLEFPSQPWYLEGYHRPALTDPDNAVYEIIASLMGDGRTSRLYQSLIEKQQIALAADGDNGFPGDKYPNLLLFYGQTAPNATVDQLQTALHAEIERLKTEPVSEQELDRVKNQLRADLLRSLDSNLGMAQLLVAYQVKTGDWRNLFTQINAIMAVTPADIQRVAQATFTAQNRTTARIVPPAGKPVNHSPLSSK